MAAAGLAIGLVGWGFGYVKTRPPTMVLIAGGAAFVNELLGLINERGWYRWWFVYALSLLDVLLVAVLVVWFGHGGVVGPFFLPGLTFPLVPGSAAGDLSRLTPAPAALA